MNKNEFIEKIGMIVPSSEFKNNGHLIDILPTSMYELFLELLSYTCCIKKTFKSIDIVNELCKQLETDWHYILDTIPTYQRLIKNLNM